MLIVCFSFILFIAKSIRDVIQYDNDFRKWSSSYPPDSESCTVYNNFAMKIAEFGYAWWTLGWFCVSCERYTLAPCELLDSDVFRLFMTFRWHHYDKPTLPIKLFVPSLVVIFVSASECLEGNVPFVSDGRRRRVLLAAA